MTYNYQYRTNNLDAQSRKEVFRATGRNSGPSARRVKDRRQFYVCRFLKYLNSRQFTFKNVKRHSPIEKFV